tara:strand:+ start:170 stop:415 length:246 start_codon:yes stop_codon:yes gene_type:complete
MKKDMQLARLLNEIHEQWARDNGYRDKQQASSLKLQASEKKSGKRQAPSTKLQAPSHKRQAHGSLTLEKVSRTFDRGALLK